MSQYNRPLADGQMAASSFSSYMHAFMHHGFKSPSLESEACFPDTEINAGLALNDRMGQMGCCAYSEFRPQETPQLLYSP